MLRTTSKIKVSVQLKLTIFSAYIQSQLLSDLKLYDLTPTWVEQTLDALCVKYIRDWLELPISTCVAEVLQLPKAQGGFGIHSFKLLADKMRLVKRHALWSSSETDVRNLASASAQTNCKIDEYIAANKGLSNAKKSLKSDYEKKASQHLFNLQCQGPSFKVINENISKKMCQFLVKNSATNPLKPIYFC